MENKIINPEIEIELIGVNNNIFAIIGSVCKQCRRQNAKPTVIDNFRNEAMKGSYDDLLKTVFKHFEVVG